jgi:hypothetical protein
MGKIARSVREPGSSIFLLEIPFRIIALDPEKNPEERGESAPSVRQRSALPVRVRVKLSPSFGFCTRS